MNLIHHIQQWTCRLLPGDDAMGAIKRRATKAAAHTLLVTYALFIFKPVMPLVTDSLAHIFWNNLHMAVVHKVNGKEHVHYELRKMADETGKDKAGLKDKTVTEESYTLPVVLKINRSIAFSSRIPKHIAHYKRSHEDAVGTIEIPPPKQA